MINYNPLLTINNQLISIVEKYNNNNEYLTFIYYTCCMLGGYESIDYLIHLLVFNIRKITYIDITLYYPYKVNIENKMNETIKYYDFYNLQEKEIINIFIDKIIKLKPIIINNVITYYPLNYMEYYNNTITLRGFNQFINFNKVYEGNFYEYGRIVDYFINNIDIEIMLKLIKNNKNCDMIKIFKIYFQTPQLMHENKHFWINKETLIADHNICIDYRINNKNCKDRKNKYNSNIILSLLTYGDCRDNALLLEFYCCLIEWNEYIELIKNFNQNQNKIINLIRNQNRIVNVDVYFNGYYTNYNEKTKPISEYKINNNLDNLDKSIKDNIYIYKKQVYFYYENHVFVVKTNFHNNKCTFKAIDIMYNKYDLTFLNDYIGQYRGDYIVDNKKIIINNVILELGRNDFNLKLNTICKMKTQFFNKIRYEKNLKNKLLFLSDDFIIPNNFYDINNFIITRESILYKLRQKYFNKNIKVEHYDNKPSNKIKYFLLEDI